MVGLHAARFDSAVVLIPGRRGAPIFDSGSRSQGAIEMADDAACGLAGAGACALGCVSPFDVRETDELDIRRHTVADRPGLRAALPPGPHAPAVAMDRAR